MIRIELIILPSVALAAIVAAFLFHWLARRWVDRKQPRPFYHDRPSDSGWFLGAIFSWIIAGVLLPVTLVAAFPLSPHYWFYEQKSGQIESLSNRFVDASGDLSSSYVITLDGKPLVVEDQRILTYEVGDSITLNCLPTWVYGAADRYYCNIIG